MKYSFFYLNLLLYLSKKITASWAKVVQNLFQGNPQRH